MRYAAEEYAKRFQIPLDVATRDLQLTWQEWDRTLLSPPSLPSPPPPILCPLVPSPEDPSVFSRTYRLFDRSINVVLDDVDLIAEISPRLEPLLTVPACYPDATLWAIASSTNYHLFEGSNWLCSRSHPADARVSFLQEFARVAQASTGWAALLHAGACGTEDSCIVFPAVSRSGKTTLSAALVHAGMSFYADDSVALQCGSLAVSTMPFAMMIREGSWPAVSLRFPEFANRRVHKRYGENVRFLNPIRPARKAAPAAAIVFTRWEAGVDTTFKSLGAAETLMRLNESGCWITHDRDSIQAFLDWIQSLPSYELVYSDLSEAISLIRKLASQ